MRQVRGVVMPCSQNPYCQVGDPQTGGQWQQQRFFPRNKEYKLNTEFTNLEILHQEDECTLKNIWLWRPIGLIFWRSKELWEIETLLWKGAHKIFYDLGPKAEAVIWKEPGHQLILKSLLERQLELTLGTETQAAAIFWAPFTTRTLVLARIILEFPSSFLARTRLTISLT